MVKRGRPSKDDKDLPVLVDMAQRWVNSCRKSSVYSLAQPHAKARYLADIDVKTDPHRAKGKLLKNGIKSTSKRLQRKFIKLRDRDEGTILRIGAYLEMARIRWRALQQDRGPVTGPFSNRWLDDPGFVRAQDKAVKTLALTLSITTDDARGLADEGLMILRKWFPEMYSDFRI